MILTDTYLRVGVACCLSPLPFTLTTSYEDHSSEIVRYLTEKGSHLNVSDRLRNCSLKNLDPYYVTMSSLTQSNCLKTKFRVCPRLEVVSLSLSPTLLSSIDNVTEF